MLAPKPGWFLRKVLVSFLTLKLEQGAATVFSLVVVVVSVVVVVVVVVYYFERDDVGCGFLIGVRDAPLEEE